MSNRKLQEFNEYVYGPRSVLRPGDLFRVSGGPVYENEDGSTTLMAERGTFKFLRYCIRGADKWIEAQQVGGGVVVLWVGKKKANPDLPSFKRRPYKVRKVSERKRKGGKKQEAGPAVEALCEAKQKVANGKDAGHKAVATVRGSAAAGGTKRTKPPAKAGPKPKTRAGSTLGNGKNPGKTGGRGGAGRGKSPPSTSGSTSI